MTAQTLRPYQLSAVDELRKGFRVVRRQVLVVPTGGGKTTIAAHLIRASLDVAAGSSPAGRADPNHVLFLAHRTELIEQCSARLDANGVSEHGVIMGQHHRHRPFAPVQVASVDTLANRQKLHPHPKIIIADECHRSLGARQTRVIRELYPSALVIGLTATPWRLDGRGLGELYEALVEGARYSDLIRDGYILDPRVLCPWRPDLREIAVGADGEYIEADVARVMGRRQTIADIVTAWRAHADGARTVAFAASIEHSRHIVAAFVEAGVTAEHLDGTTAPDERRSILARLAAGATRVVSNYGVLTEGWDCPSCEVCILARPTKSLALYMQCVGRVLRPAEGKPRALVIDVAGCVLEHGWPTADRPWTLDGTAPGTGKGKSAPAEAPAVQVSICPGCFTAAAGPIAVCAQCGWSAAEVRPDTVTRSGVPLVEVTASTVARRSNRRTYPARYTGAWARNNQHHRRHTA